MRFGGIPMTSSSTVTMLPDGSLEYSRPGLTWEYWGIVNGQKTTVGLAASKSYVIYHSESVEHTLSGQGGRFPAVSVEAAKQACEEHFRRKQELNHSEFPNS